MSACAGDSVDPTKGTSFPDGRFPALFVNHGGGPLPLLGRQPDIASHLRDAASSIPAPRSIVVISAHWESDPIRITSHPSPAMLYDYGGFPPETYQYEYSAPGDPELAQRIQTLMRVEGIEAELDSERGFDHGVFVPLMIMYPEANVPVVCVSLHSSLSASVHLRIGRALRSLSDDGVLLLGSGYTFHNMRAFFHSDNGRSLDSAVEFNSWLKDAMLKSTSATERNKLLERWEDAPGGRMCHPREEHLLPLLVLAGAAEGGGKGVGDATVQLSYDTTGSAREKGEHAVTGYRFV
eukprot:CAMPEP_0197439260 /NCGR_PEP_ID=MMETSP1175-20131217/6042_1 /TAXON_ID=1003142 /ORGANISM="Triceratium dubium, Strain CCMP147" /LENGTH=293 /DNA_ID=CAMNT_0042969139 /DNA_START=115 /DNA_END=996 /DNA_ORIENTATION=+